MAQNKLFTVSKELCVANIEGDIRTASKYLALNEIRLYL